MSIQIVEIAQPSVIDTVAVAQPSTVDVVEVRQGPAGPAGTAGPSSVTSATTSDGTANLSLAAATVSGTLTAPTAATTTSTTQVATTAFVQQELASGVAVAKNLEFLAHNGSGSTIAKGSIVYINGAVGGVPRITKSQANNDTNSARTIGFVKADIANGANGFVIIEGELLNVSTADSSGIIGAGIQLYLSPTTPGAFTRTKPSAPNHLVYVGVVVTASTGANLDGKILVGIQNGYELNEIHDVSITAPVAAKQVIKRNAGNTLWVNEAIVSADVSDATDAATPSTLVRRDASGGANFAGTVNLNTGVISDLQFEDYQAANGATFLYNGTSASDHRIALGAGTTGATLFGAADAGAARTTLGLGTTDAVQFGNGTFATGSIATSQPLTLTQTWATAAATYAGMRVNVTDSGPSNAASLLMDLQVGGVSQAKFRKDGLLTCASINASSSGSNFASITCSSTGVFLQTGGRLGLSNTGYLGFSASGDATGALDLQIYRDGAANTLAQRNGTNAQTSRIYDTYASATDYHRLAIATARATTTGMSGATITLTNIIPAGAVVVGVTCKVTTAITGATSFQLGTAADPDRFGAAIAITLGATSDNQNWTSGTVECFPSATSLILTANSSNFTGGAVYVSVQYLSGQAD